MWIASKLSSILITRMMYSLLAESLNRVPTKEPTRNLGRKAGKIAINSIPPPKPISPGNEELRLVKYTQIQLNCITQPVGIFGVIFQIIPRICMNQDT
ncbi:hypothetical protein VIM7927_02369 [Vibrio mangrovi]|uniref:Uncharacterized protein n=1 Tax=Vibrio mangrovi TaxID=474394 RepID=A0A1Y6IX73_9VIBR|nr:hypothetical protein VIM7927_02369 [Vibrio mangrovi]